MSRTHTHASADGAITLVRKGIVWMLAVMIIIWMLSVMIIIQRALTPRLLQVRKVIDMMPRAVNFPIRCYGKAEFGDAQVRLLFSATKIR
jgi:hypothetical protein